MTTWRDDLRALTVDNTDLACLPGRKRRLVVDRQTLQRALEEASRKAYNNGIQERYIPHVMDLATNGSERAVLDVLGVHAQWCLSDEEFTWKTEPREQTLRVRTRGARLLVLDLPLWILDV